MKIFLAYFILSLTGCILHAQTKQIINQSQDSTSFNQSYNFDESGNGVFGRKVTKRSISVLKVMAGMKSDKLNNIGIKVCIDPKGQVTNTSLIEDETTINDDDAIKKILDAAYEYEFEKSLSNNIECGKIVLKSDPNFKK